MTHLSNCQCSVCWVQRHCDFLAFPNSSIPLTVNRAYFVGLNVPRETLILRPSIPDSLVFVPVYAGSLPEGL